VADARGIDVDVVATSTRSRDRRFPAWSIIVRGVRRLRGRGTFVDRLLVVSLAVFMVIDERISLALG
jgi:hypothetical protein